MAAIVERHLVRFAPQKDGSINIIEDHHTDVGDVHRHVYKAPQTTTQADAVAAMNSRDIIPDLTQREENALHDRVEAGEIDPATYVPKYTTTARVRRLLAARFARTSYETNPRFVRRMATLIDSFTAQQIANALGISVSRANKLKNRADRILTVIIPASDADELEIDDGGAS